MEKWRHEGVQRDERIQRMRERNEKDFWAKKEREDRRREKERTEVTKVDHGRSVFKFQDVKVDVRAGKDGRGLAGVGARYGVPHQDRKRGMIKIPTRVG
jgi:ribosomal protein L3